MLNSDQDLHPQPNRHVTRSRSPQQTQIVTELSIEQSYAMPIFAEATALAIQLAAAPVAILTTIAGTGYQIGAISGLGQLSAMPSNPNLQLELAGLEYCHDRIISTQSSLSLPNLHQHPQLANSALLRVQGLVSYLGVPVITAARDRLGTLAILDFKPRQFSDREIELLLLVSRLLASDFERKLLSQAQLNHWIGDLQYRVMPNFDDAVATDPLALDGSSLVPNLISVSEADREAMRSVPHLAIDHRIDRVGNTTQFELLTHLVQELRTPLTSVLGMASVLQQEIYGSLTTKQKDYLGIIYQSGRQLVTIVDEISQLGGLVGEGSPTARIDLQQQQPQLTLKLVDLEMLCQLAIQSLKPIATKKQQQIALDPIANVTPTAERLWLLDKDKVRQIIYYLCLSVIHASALDRQISIQLTHRPDLVEIHITTNDPDAILPAPEPIELELSSPSIDCATASTAPTPSPDLRIRLGLSLGHILAAAHGGTIELTPQGRGYRFRLPLIVVPSVAESTQN
jgi:signal transduction histidine kinase